MICTVDDCTKPTRRATSGLCAMHYHRQYRHGSVHATQPPALPVVRYKLVRGRSNHPVAGPSGRAYLHRVVLYDAIGDGLHSCHWCGREIRWIVGLLPPWPPDYLAVDHVNADRHDNRLENLVASCQPCNSTRAQRARHERILAAGLWANHDTVARLAPRRSDRFA